jgi:SulP family sulfate permease
MSIKNLSSQLSTGIIVGLSSIVYAISHGALLFSGEASNFIAIGLTSALITAVVCALGSCFFNEKTFVMGTDSSTVSVMVGSLLVVDTLVMPSEVSQATILAIIFLLSLVSGSIFYLVARLELANFVRFVPFSVMAGLLASTGWLMCSGALMIISEVSLSVAGFHNFIGSPFRPEMLIGCLVAITLLGLSKKISSAILIPIVIIAFALPIHYFLNSSYCVTLEGVCSERTWLFASSSQASWIPFWHFDFASIHLYSVLKALPSMFVVAFVGVITILLSIASLELTYKKEFDLNQALRVHAGSSIVSALFGGFLGIISTGRTTLNRVGGGSLVSNIIVALMCLLILLGGSGVLTLIPRAAMGGVILFLGLSMLKHWVWDQRKVLSRGEFAEVTLILIVVANFGYLAGFGLGIAMSCIAFVVACSKSPLTSLRTDLSMFSSSVVRHERQRQLITERGHQSLILKLSGYIFFGSASNIELIFHEVESRRIQNILLDFSDVIGIDRSAIGVFHRILRRDKLSNVHFYFVYGEHNKNVVYSIAPLPGSGPTVSFYSHMDLGVEAIEESIISANEHIDISVNCFDFLRSLDDQNILMRHCKLVMFVSGQTLCEEGDRSNEIYFLKKGALEIIKKEGSIDIRLTKLSDGAIVGEMAFYSGAVRSATIRATSNSEVYVLDGQSLKALRSAYPDLASQLDVFVIKKLANALTRANKLIASLH